jgi:SPP1 gp7 family putative phage head morphogenesis protein
LLVEEDAFGLKPISHDPFTPTTNTRWRFETNPQKLKLFQDWLKKTFGKHLKNQAIDKLWEAYILEGFRKGAGRAFDDTKQEEGKKPDSVLPSPQLDFYNGTKMEFLRSAFGQPETIEKVKLLASRTYDGMEGVTSAMATKMSRLLTDGLVQGMNPRTIANLLSSEINIGKARAETIARTELIRAHAEGQLLAFQKLGVEEVGAAVEWSTAGDERVCHLCKPLEGVVLKTSEAAGMIPRHPNCRCAWIPAGVGEVNQKQLKTKKQIETAILKSRKLGNDGFKAAKPIAKHRPEGVV